MQQRKNNPHAGAVTIAMEPTKEKKNSVQHSEKHATTVVRKTSLPVDACQSKRTPDKKRSRLKITQATQETYWWP